MIDFFIPGAPVPQARPRFSNRGKFTVAYDPKQCVDYKSWVKVCALEAMAKIGMTMVAREIPLVLSLMINLQKPKSAPKTREIFPTKKPDCDNVLKGIQDAMESVVYAADQQIVSVMVTKRYSEVPGVNVIIGEMQY